MPAVTMRGLLVLLLALLVAAVAHAQQQQQHQGQGKRPFSRLQATTGGGAEPAVGAEEEDMEALKKGAWVGGWAGRLDWWLIGWPFNRNGRLGVGCVPAPSILPLRTTTHRLHQADGARGIPAEPDEERRGAPGHFELGDEQPRVEGTSVWLSRRVWGSIGPPVRPPPHIRPSHINARTHLNPTTKQALLQDAEIQHRVLEANPLLESFDGFKELKEGGRRLSAEEVGGCVGWGRAGLGVL